MANAIVTNVEERCRCNFTRSNITSDRSLCFPRSDFNAVTYRGDIHETDTTKLFDLINHIVEWTARGNVLIRVQDVFVKVDNSCRVAIESISEQECLPRVIATIATTSIASDNGSSTVIGGSVLAVVIILILIGVVVVSFVLKSRKTTYSLQDTKRRYALLFQ